MAINSYPKDSNVQLSPHFNVSEFRCPCSQCTTTILDSGLITKLEAMRGALGLPLKINSGYRCANYQSELRLRGYETSTGRSTHEDGRAADCMAEPLTGLELEKAARSSGFKAVGVASSWAHVDLRNDKDRRWVYLKR